MEHADRSGNAGMGQKAGKRGTWAITISAMTPHYFSIMSVFQS